MSNSELSRKELRVLYPDVKYSGGQATSSERVFEVYDPPMCCSTGVCSLSVDTVLIEFAQNMEWLKRKGVDVVRYNLSQQPGAFVQNSEVSRLLSAEGNNCLPITVLNGKFVTSRYYPGRDELARILDLE